MRRRQGREPPHPVELGGVGRRVLQPRSPKGLLPRGVVRVTMEPIERQQWTGTAVHPGGPTRPQLLCVSIGMDW